MLVAGYLSLLQSYFKKRKKLIMWERGGVIEVQFLSSGERMMSSAHWRDCSKQGTWTAHSLEGI